MALEWQRPSKGEALSAAATVAGLIATRNEFIGWGSYLAGWFANATSHPFETVMLTIAVGLMGYAHWRPLLGLVGVRERPGPRWRSDADMGDEVLSWARKRAATLDNTSDQRAHSKKEVGFSFVMAPDERPVNILKVVDQPGIQLTVRTVPTDEHEATVLGMDEADYRAMVDEITLELVTRVGPTTVVAERIVSERGAPADKNGDEIPVGAFIATGISAAALTESSFVEAVNMLRRGTVIAQTLIRKHVRLEDARRGRVSHPEDISADLSVAASSSVASTLDAGPTSEGPPS